MGTPLRHRPGRSGSPPSPPAPVASPAFPRVPAFVVYAVATGLVTALVALARLWVDYPVCVNDEQRYADILRTLADGGQWPVSGPGFVLVAGWVKAATGAGFGQALGWLGIAGAGASVLVILACYHRLLPGRAAAPGSLALLCVSGYFLAPLVESRPQQLGQVLVLAGLLLAWVSRWDRRLLRFALLHALTAWFHILSFAVLTAAALLLWGWQTATGDRPLRRAWIPLAALLPGLAILGMPHGPYLLMLHDLVHNHLSPAALGALAPAAAVVLGAGALGWRVLARRRPDPARFARALAQVNGLPFALRLGGVLLAGAVPLALQYAQLPDGYGLHYADSWGRFLFLHLGDLLFLLLLTVALLRLLESAANAGVPAGLGPFVATSAATLLLALLSLALSMAALDKNLFLRLLNYLLLFTAPLAQAGFTTLSGRARILVLSLFPLGLFTSLLSALKHPGWMQCIGG